MDIRQRICLIFSRVVVGGFLIIIIIIIIFGFQDLTMHLI